MRYPGCKSTQLGDGTLVMNIQIVKNVRNSDLNKAMMPPPLLVPARNARISSDICVRLVWLRDSTMPGERTVVRLSPSVVAMSSVDDGCSVFIV